MVQKFIKYFYFSCNFFLGTFFFFFFFFWHFLSIVMLCFDQRKHHLFIISFFKPENTQNFPAIPRFHD